MMNDECEISLNQSKSVINVFLWCEVNTPSVKISMKWLVKVFSVTNKANLIFFF